MDALLLIQANSSGIADISSYSRDIPSKPERVSTINGRYYYDMGGDSGVKFRHDARLPLAQKIMTVEGWISSPVATSQANEMLLGGFTSSGYNFGFYVGFAGDGFAFSTGDGIRDYSVIPNFPVGTPTHFAWVLNGARKLLYLNGVKVVDVALSRGVSVPSSITLGGMSPTNNPKGLQSRAKVHQFIIWDSVKYTANFTPNYIDYEQQYMGVNNLSVNGKTVPADYNGAIADKVLIKGVPTQRKVAIYKRGTNELVGVTWSDAAGNYRFDNLQSGIEYYVLSIDHERNYNAVIQDMIRTDL